MTWCFFVDSVVAKREKGEKSVEKKMKRTVTWVCVIWQVGGCCFGVYALIISASANLCQMPCHPKIAILTGCRIDYEGRYTGYDCLFYVKYTERSGKMTFPLGLCYAFP